MLHFFKTLFQRKTPRQLRLLGRGGVVYYNEGKEYYIDTDNMNIQHGKNLYDIYYKDIRLMNSTCTLTNNEKKKIAMTIKALLEEKGSAEVRVLP